MHEDLRSQVTAGDLLRSRWSGDDLPATGAPVAMAPEAGDLHMSRDQVLLKVLGHFHRLPQRRMAAGALGQLLLDRSVDVGGFGPSHSRMPRFLTGSLATVANPGREAVKNRPGRAQLLEKFLNFLSERGISLFKPQDQLDQFCLRQLPDFLTQTQKHSPCVFRGVP